MNQPWSSLAVPPDAIIGVLNSVFQPWPDPGTSIMKATIPGNPFTNRMPKCALRLLFSQRRWPAAYMSRDSEQGAVRDRSLQDLEGLDWGEANFDSHLVKFPRSQSPGYFAIRSTGDGGGPAISCRLSRERQIGREDRRKIDMIRRAAGSEPC